MIARVAPVTSLTRLALLCALLGALAVPSSASAIVYGMGDEDATMFTTPLFTGLPIQNVRYVVAYDAALSDNFEIQQADNFMDAAHSAGYDILVSFEHSREPKKASQLPTNAQYLKGVRAFMHRYPYVNTYSPWDEINDCSQPTCKNPRAAAGYYLTLSKACTGCTVMAAEVLDTNEPSTTVAYLRQYQQALHGAQPKLWGLHNYSDVNRHTSTGTKAVLGAVKGTVWLTETGGLYKFLPGFPASTSRQVTSEQWMFHLASSSPRLQRLYIYSWTGGGVFDAGLTDASGLVTRPAYDVVKQQLTS
jgi:hypothetical protein